MGYTKKEKSLLLVLENYNSFYKKYLDKIVDELDSVFMEIFALIGEFDGEIDLPITIVESRDFHFFAKNLDEHRFLTVLEVAENLGVNQVHFCRIFEPQKLFIAIKTFDHKFKFEISFSVFGLSEYIRRPIYSRYMEKLIRLPCIKKVLIHSVSPCITKKYSNENSIYLSDNVAFVHDPMYESYSDYNISKESARQELGFGQEDTLILYFGSYFYSKGPDLLLTVARDYSNQKGIKFLFVGSTSTASFDINIDNYKSKNTHFVDRFVSDQEAIKYITASDLVVLPYRKFYRYDTSGVLVQSCLAHRPCLVPNFEPFSTVVEEHGIGFQFEAESNHSLKNAIDEFLISETKIDKANYKRYIDLIESWKCFAKLLITPSNIKI